MPTKSPAQHRLMEAVAHNPKFARQAGIPQSVGREMVEHDADPLVPILEALQVIERKLAAIDGGAC
jgi:hypothetical protein